MDTHDASLKGRDQCDFIAQTLKYTWSGELIRCPYTILVDLINGSLNWDQNYMLLYVFSFLVLSIEKK